MPSFQSFTTYNMKKPLDYQWAVWLIALVFAALASSCQYKQQSQADYEQIKKDSIMMSQSPTQWGDVSFKRHWSPDFNYPDSISRVWVTAYDTIIIVDDTEFFGRWRNKAYFELYDKGMIFISPTDFIIRDSNANLVYKAWDRY